MAKPGLGAHREWGVVWVAGKVEHQAAFAEPVVTRVSPRWPAGRVSLGGVRHGAAPAASGIAKSAARSGMSSFVVYTFLGSLSPHRMVVETPRGIVRIGRSRN